MTQELWNVLTKTTDWVKHSDTKATILLTIHGVLLTIVYTNADNVYNYSFENWFTILLTFCTALTSLTSIIYCFLAINPKLKNPNPTSLIYFGHIQKSFSDHKDYYDAVKNTFSKRKKLNKQLSEQIYINSIVAWKKFKLITISMRYIFATIILLLINLLFYLLSR